MNFRPLFLLSTLLASFAVMPAFAQLRSGDVILISLPCHLCSAIETEEGAPYSHLGLVLIENGATTVLEAYERVEQTPLADFLSRARPGSKILVRHPLDAEGRPLNLDSAKLSKRFHAQFEGLAYDSEFLWDNRTASGEKLYCSEFAAKFLEPYLPSPLPTKPMHFTLARAEWLKFFHGHPPDGKPGISPGDFSRFPGFQTREWAPRAH